MTTIYDLDKIKTENKNLRTALDMFLSAFNESDGEISADMGDLVAIYRFASSLSTQTGTDEKGNCIWKPTRDQDDIPFWSTGCGDEFVLLDGTPRENHMTYCPYCGRAIEQKEYTNDEEVQDES